jgi:DNA-binding XRE family transcriptional regulator
MSVMNIHRKAISNTPIKIWLRDARISQSHLGSVLGVTRATINGKVNGWIAWQPRDLELLHSEFGLSSDYVLGFSCDPYGKEVIG